MSDIQITVIEDPSDILADPRAKERLMSELKHLLLEKGLIVSIDVNEPIREEDTSSEHPLPQS